MKKRILAWVMLIGFVLLLINLMTIRYQPVLSFAVYFIILVGFLFTNKRQDAAKAEKKQEEDK